MTTETNNPPAADTMPLDRLPIHACGVIVDVDADDAEMERLMAMGVCKGHALEVIQHGDPLIIKVVGTRIGMSARLARRVLVNPDPHMGCPMAEKPNPVKHGT